VEVVPTLGACVGDQLGFVVVQLAEDHAAAEVDLFDSRVVLGETFLPDGKVLPVLLDIDVRNVIGGAHDHVTDPNGGGPRRWAGAEPRAEVGAELQVVRLVGDAARVARLIAVDACGAASADRRGDQRRGFWPSPTTKPVRKQIEGKCKSVSSQRHSQPKRIQGSQGELHEAKGQADQAKARQPKTEQQNPSHPITGW
jgi:hypothetical protein